MASYDEEDESHNGSSEDEIDENEADADAENDAEGDNFADGDADNDNDNDNEDEDEDQEDDDQDQDEQDEQDESHERDAGAGTLQSNPTVLLTSPSPRPGPEATNVETAALPVVRPEAVTATVYDIVPTIAAPHSTSINTMAATSDMKWVFTGGTDGYIRKFNWVDTANGKLMLTVAQRHPFVDSVTKAGVLMSYWENEEPHHRTTPPLQSDEPPSLSPVYSLAVQKQALWLLSGLESGGINLQTVRHQEGHRITCLKGHTSAVSVLTLAKDELSCLSGSWDKTIKYWDLNTGQVVRTFEGSGGQISAIERRPNSDLPIPRDMDNAALADGTFSSNNAAEAHQTRSIDNGIHGAVDGVSTAGNPDEPDNPADDGSLFGDNSEHNSLFGDDDAAPGPSANAFGDDDDNEFTRAIENELRMVDADGDLDMEDVGGPVQPPAEATSPDKLLTNMPAPEPAVQRGSYADPMDGIVNGEEETSKREGQHEAEQTTTDDQTTTSENTFLDASFEGTLRVWDRRQPNPVARMAPPRSTPPWCMNACWSFDGNFIYAGRRNGTIDEYSLYKGLREPVRTFKFPAGSGPVSAVRAMPNGRHLICASHDILRLYDLKAEENPSPSVVPFLIVPGHRTGVISQLYIDPTCTFMISTAGNRGWEGTSTEVLLGYEIGLGH